MTKTDVFTVNQSDEISITIVGPQEKAPIKICNVYQTCVHNGAKEIETKTPKIGF